MRAVVIREFGPPEVLEPADVDEVRAGPGEVIIDVQLANVTFVETQVRAGKPPHPSMLPPLPAILGNGVGGTVADHPVVASLLAAGGRFCPFGMASGSFAPVTPELARAHQVTVRAGAAASPAELAALARTALAEAAAGRLRPVIGQEFALAAAAHAHAAIEARTTVGKTLLTVPR